VKQGSMTIIYYSSYRNSNIIDMHKHYHIPTVHKTKLYFNCK